MKILFLIPLLWLLSSCAIEALNHGSELATVEIDDSEFDTSVEVDRLQAKDSTEYGPSFDNETSEGTSSPAPSVKVLGLTFYPAGNLSVGYLGFLKQLEKNKIHPNILVCPELSALVCILYGKYKDMNRVEWELYNFISKLKEKSFLSPEWNDLFQDLLLKEFKKERLERLKLVIGVPVRLSDKRIKIYSRGEIVKIMKENLNISSSYPGSIILDKQLNFSKFITSRGADIYSGISIQPANKIMHSNNGFLLGVYSKLFYSTKAFLGDQDFLIKVDKEVDNAENILGLPNIVAEKSIDGITSLKERMAN